jgi:hypothetical protein
MEVIPVGETTIAPILPVLMEIREHLAMPVAVVAVVAVPPTETILLAMAAMEVPPALEVPPVEQDSRVMLVVSGDLAAADRAMAVAVVVAVVVVDQKAAPGGTKMPVVVAEVAVLAIPPVEVAKVDLGGHALRTLGTVQEVAVLVQAGPTIATRRRSLSQLVPPAIQPASR